MYHEPCMCGAFDCRSCYPGRQYQKPADSAVEDTDTADDTVYCARCGVAPVISLDTAYCDDCVEDIVEWLMADDAEYLAQLQRRYEDMMYSNQANEGQ